MAVHHAVLTGLGSQVRADAPRAPGQCVEGEEGGGKSGWGLALSIPLATAHVRPLRARRAVRGGSGNSLESATLNAY